MSRVRPRRSRTLDVGWLERRVLLSDTTPPTTVASVTSGTLGTNNVYVTPVMVHLIASDVDDPANTLTTFFSVDGGMTKMGNNVTLTLGDGSHTILYHSQDPAGNAETPHSFMVNVDLTTPVVTASASPTTLWPPNHKLVGVTVTGTVTDASGGVPGMVHYQVLDEYGRVQPSGNAPVVGGNYSFGVNLQASRTGQDKDGRLYTIVVTAVDEAGNTGSARTFVVVPHDQGHAVLIPTPTSTPAAPGISAPTSPTSTTVGTTPSTPVVTIGMPASSHGHGNKHGGKKHGGDGDQSRPVVVTPVATPVTTPVVPPVVVTVPQPAGGGGDNGGDNQGNDNGNGNGNGNDNGNGNGNGHGHGEGNGNGNGNMKR
jgi:hypothetical protein